MDKWILLLGGFLALLVIIVLINFIYGTFGEGRRKGRKRGHSYNYQHNNRDRDRDEDRYDSRERDHSRERGRDYTRNHRHASAPSHREHAR